MFDMSGSKKAMDSGDNGVRSILKTDSIRRHRIRRHRTRGLYNAVGKRIMDIILSSMMLALLSPVMLLIWLMVRSDGGAGTFVQARVGLNGKTFNCLKFRSMVPNAERVLEEMCASDPVIAEEWHTYQKLDNDPRISKIGRILRATSLDELPQIINVLKGDMSLVGPRPFLPSQQEIYDDCGGRAYYRMRPGITGAWQVFGRSATTFKDRIKYDEGYYRNLGFVSDLSLLVRTVKVVLGRTGK